MRGFVVRNRPGEETLFFCRGGKKGSAQVRAGKIGIHYVESFRPQLAYLRGEIGRKDPRWDAKAVASCPASGGSYRRLEDVAGNPAWDIPTTNSTCLSGIWRHGNWANPSPPAKPTKRSTPSSRSCRAFTPPSSRTWPMPRDKSMCFGNSAKPIRIEHPQFLPRGLLGGVSPPGRRPNATFSISRSSGAGRTCPELAVLPEENSRGRGTHREPEGQGERFPRRRIASTRRESSSLTRPKTVTSCWFRTS